MIRFHDNSPAARARKDTAVIAKADEERAAGIPDREPDVRETWCLDLRAINGPNWRCVPSRYKSGFNVYDAETGVWVMYAVARAILAEARRKTPRPMAWRSTQGLQ